MRTPVNAFYYPDMISSDLTLKKAILFFDELHFVDQASYSFGGGGHGQNHDDRLCIPASFV